jgi:hypothetical protein
MLGDLPDYNSRTKKRVLLFAVLFVCIAAAALIYRHDRHTTRPSQELKSGIKALTDPESLVKDL